MLFGYFIFTCKCFLFWSEVVLFNYTLQFLKFTVLQILTQCNLELVILTLKIMSNN